MAQAGYTPISLYHSTTGSAAPTNTNLVNGELAINITDGKLYYKDNANVVKVIAFASNIINTPTAGGAVYGTGTALAITAAGTAGQVLTSNGTGAPTWQNASGGLSKAEVIALTMTLGF